MHFCVLSIFYVQFLLLGAVPFPKHVFHLKDLGVEAVVTLNEPYETLVSPSLYEVIISVKIFGKHYI
mgnify:CR=1 FL=1